MLARCATNECRFAVQLDQVNKQWQYSFEAEGIICTIAATRSANNNSCQGVIHHQLLPLATSQPHHMSNKSLAVFIDSVGQARQSRPTFAKLYDQAPDKNQFLKVVLPSAYFGTGLGVRSSFCNLIAQPLSELCGACECLSNLKSLWERGTQKGISLTALASHVQQHKPVSINSSRHDYLVNPELRQLSLANSSSRHKAAVASDRFKSALEECRAELARVTDSLQAGQDNVPAFMKTFRIAAEKGDSAVPYMHCLTSSASDVRANITFSLILTMSQACAGVLSNHNTLVEFLNDVGEALVHGTKHRKLSVTTQSIYVR